MRGRPPATRAPIGVAALAAPVRPRRSRVSGLGSLSTRRAFLREFAELTDAYERQLEGRDLAAGVARLRAGLAALTAALLHLERAATAREAAA